jgi:hypothetical protein
MSPAASPAEGDRRARNLAAWQATTCRAIRKKTSRAFHAMRRRCQHATPLHGWKNYGQRRALFASLAEFVAEVGPAPGAGPDWSIGRHLDRGDYRPGVADGYDPADPQAPRQVAWQTAEEQADSRPHARRFAIDGQTLTVRGWAEVRDVDYCRLDNRVRRGQPVEQALDELERLRKQGKAPGYRQSRSHYLQRRAARRRREREAGKARHRPGQNPTSGAEVAEQKGRPPSDCEYAPYIGVSSSNEPCQPPQPVQRRGQGGVISSSACPMPSVRP